MDSATRLSIWTFDMGLYCGSVYFYGQDSALGYFQERRGRAKGTLIL